MATATATSTNGEQITREDLEASFAKILGEGEKATKKIIPPALITAGVLGAITIFVFYLLGRRRGRRRSAVVEVHRI